LKASGSIVGLVEGFAQATQNIVQGFSGALSDKLQKRKAIALAGYLLAAIAKPLMGLSTAWQGVFGARLLDRLGAGSRSAPRDALIASSVDKENRGRAFGLEGVGDNAGAFLGPLLAVLLLYALHVGMRAVFYLAIIPGLLAFFMVLLVKERPAAVAAKSKIDVGLRQFPQAYWRYLIVIALFGLGIFLIAYLGFALAQNILVVAVLFVFYGLYQGIFRAVGKALASDFVPERLRASGIGWYGTTLGLLELVASVVAGFLWDQVGHVSVFYYGATFAVVGSIGLLLLIPGKHDR
jgi:MFS family permease